MRMASDTKKWIQIVNIIFFFFSTLIQPLEENKMCPRDKKEPAVQPNLFGLRGGKKPATQRPRCCQAKKKSCWASSLDAKEY